MSGSVRERLRDPPSNSCFVHLGAKIGERARSKAVHIFGLRSNVGRVTGGCNDTMRA